jgi:AcrR family transcriptional regulator
VFVGATGLATGKRERRKTATRKELIQAGRRLFGEKGLYESRIEDLTAQAGIAKGTLYSYFADKDELVRAVASSGFTELEQYVSRRVHRASHEHEILLQAVRAHLDFFDENPDLMRVFHQVRGMLKFDRSSWRPLRGTINAYLGALARLLSKARRVEDLRPSDRIELATVLFGAISGVTSVARASGTRTPRKRETQVLVASLIAMAEAHISLLAGQS